MRPIDADAIPYTMLYKENWMGCTGIEKRGVWKDTIDAMPTIEERKTGRWIDSGIHSRTFDIFGVRTWASRMMCDQCGFVTHAIEGRMEQYNFCPNCGADMRGENHD